MEKEPINWMEHFAYHHLPSNLQHVSSQFYTLASFMQYTLPLHNHQTDIAFQKLLEAKDAAVRAFRTQ